MAVVETVCLRLGDITARIIVGDTLAANTPLITKDELIQTNIALALW